MNRANAIKKKCLECSGIPKEVTLCHIVHCPLWPFRFGYSIKDKRGKKRLESAKERYPKDYQEMVKAFHEYRKSWPDLPEYVQIDEFLEKKAGEFELTKLLNLTEEYYQKVVRPLTYNYIRDKKYFQRNAAIALGNTGDPAFVPDLAKAMEEPEDLVRAYAAWALGRIGGNKAKKALETSLSRENSESAVKEIEAALARG